MQRQCTGTSLWGRICHGLTEPLRAKSYSRATSCGCTAASEPQRGPHGRLCAQIGQPVPYRALCCTVASQIWSCPHLPSWHTHVALWREPRVTRAAKPGGLSECSWAARSGMASCSVGCPASPASHERSTGLLHAACWVLCAPIMHRHTSGMNPGDSRFLVGLSQPARTGAHHAGQMVACGAQRQSRARTRI